MQLHFLVAAFAGLAIAAPRPQDINLDAVDAAPDPIIVTPAVDVSIQVATVLPVAAQVLAASAAIASDPATVDKRDESFLDNPSCGQPIPAICSNNTISERDDMKLGINKRNLLQPRDGTCAKQPKGSGPVTDPDTAEAFAHNPVLSNYALSAPTPDGYSQSFVNQAGSTSASNYIALYTLTSFDTLTCQSKCDQSSGCVAFNVYVERDPSLDPNADRCPNSPSTTNFRCTLWGVPITVDTATNHGQWRDSFHVLISASNGYNKVAAPDPIPGFTGPTAFGGAINAPLNSAGRDTYMGYKYYPFSQQQGYTPSTCAAACTAQTAYNKRHPASDGSYQTCAFVNSYVLSKNGVAQGLYCSLYSQTWGPSYATNYGQYRGSDRYTVSSSYGFSASCLNLPVAGTYFTLLDSNNNYLDQHYAEPGFYYQSAKPTYRYTLDSAGHLNSISSDTLCVYQSSGDAYYTLFLQNCGSGYVRPICKIAADLTLQCSIPDSNAQVKFGEQNGYVVSTLGSSSGSDSVTIKVIPEGC